MLADEVGLGKTIEAGLVIAQKWAERQRRILVISPSNLRKQWQQELSEKFFLPCQILESKSYKEIARNTNDYPLRHAICEEFMPSWDEERLYDLVSEYLRRDNLQALPTSQKALMTLVMRKLLASSTFAIATTLTSLSKRLKAKLTQQEPTRRLSEELAEDYEELDETIDEWGEDEPEEALSGLERSAIASEIRELDEFIKLAVSIEQNAKGEALLKVLEVAFERTEEYGGARKALIFTESRRTQEYLLSL